MLLTRSQQQAAAVSTWSPLDLGASLLAFWDAEQASTITLAGSLVTTWGDRVAGYAPTQATSGFKPAYSATSFNGRPGITFDGTDDYLNLATVPFPVLSEIWGLVDQAVLAADTSSRHILSYGGAAGTTYNRLGRGVSSGTNRTRATNGTAIADNGAVDFTGRHVVRGVFSATAVASSIDGSALATQAAATAFGATRTTIGASTATTPAGFWNGSFNAILVTAPLTAPQAAQLLAYLKTRGGIA